MRTRLPRSVGRKAIAPGPRWQPIDSLVPLCPFRLVETMAPTPRATSCGARGKRLRAFNGPERATGMKRLRSSSGRGPADCDGGSRSPTPAEAEARGGVACGQGVEQAIVSGRRLLPLVLRRQNALACDDPNLPFEALVARSRYWQQEMAAAANETTERMVARWSEEWDRSRAPHLVDARA